MDTDKLAEIIGEDLAKLYDPEKKSNFTQIVYTLSSAIELADTMGDSPDNTIAHLKNYAGLMKDFSMFYDFEMEKAKDKIEGNICEYIDDNYRRLKGKDPEYD